VTATNMEAESTSVALLFLVLFTHCHIPCDRDDDDDDDGDECCENPKSWIFHGAWLSWHILFQILFFIHVKSALYA